MPEAPAAPPTPASVDPESACGLPPQPTAAAETFARATQISRNLSRLMIHHPSNALNRLLGIVGTERKPLASVSRSKRVLATTAYMVCSNPGDHDPVMNSLSKFNPSVHDGPRRSRARPCNSTKRSGALRGTDPVTLAPHRSIRRSAVNSRVWMNGSVPPWAAAD